MLRAGLSECVCICLSECMGICARVLAWVLVSVRGCMAVVEKVGVRFLLPFFHSALVAIVSLSIVAWPEHASRCRVTQRQRGRGLTDQKGSKAFSQAPL